MLPIAISVVMYDPWPMYQQVIAFRFALRQVTLARGITPLDNVTGVLEAMVAYSPQFVAAAFGAFVGWRERRGGWQRYVNPGPRRFAGLSRLALLETPTSAQIAGAQTKPLAQPPNRYLLAQGNGLIP